MTETFERATALLPPDVRKWYARNVTPHVEPRDEDDTASPFKKGPLRALSYAPGEPDSPGHAAYWHVVLYAPVLPDFSAEFLVAHELAHAWLGHRGSSSQEEYDQNEDEANEQVSRWIDSPLASSPGLTRAEQQLAHARQLDTEVRRLIADAI